ncbi:MAG: cysteine desulfurase family protein [Alphaproteobacteria bacterium]
MSVYLDHNATSPARPEAITAVTQAMQTVGNASAQHSHGRAANRLVSDAREAVGMALGLCAQDIIFNGGGSEGDNTAIHCAVSAGCKRLLVSSMDHPATILAAEQSGAATEVIPADGQGRTDMGWLKACLDSWDPRDGRPFVSLVAANSETGVVQDVETATDLTHDAGGLIHVDAVQALGKLPMNFLPDYLAVSAHKIGGPQGVGALYVAADAPYDSLISGGGQERRRRAGTHNVAGIAGFGAAVEALTDMNHTQAMRDALEAGLKAMEPSLTIFGEQAERLPNTSFFAVPDQSSMTLMMALDMAGISVSTGTACSSGKTSESRAIRAMGLLDKAPKGAIRVSFGYNSAMADADAFLAAWANIRKRVHSTTLHSRVCGNPSPDLEVVGTAGDGFPHARG